MQKDMRKKEFMTAAKAILDAAKRFLDVAAWIAKETYLHTQENKEPELPEQFGFLMLNDSITRYY